MVPGGIVQPDRTLFRADGGDQRPAGRRYRDSFFLCRPERDLFRISALQALTPDVEPFTGISGEVHPLPVRRPCRTGAFAGTRPNLPAGRRGIEREQATGHPPVRVHLGHQHRPAVGRQIGTVRHAQFARWRPIDVACFSPGFGSRRDPHVHARTDFREHHAVVGDPRQARGIWQQPLRCSSGNRDNPRVPVPAVQLGVRDSRSVRRKDGTHFVRAVVGELKRLSFREELDVYLGRSMKCILASQKHQRAAVGRQCRRGCRVCVIRELDVIRRGDRRSSQTPPGRSTGRDQRPDDDRRECQPVSSPDVGRRARLGRRRFRSGLGLHGA